MPRWDHDRLIAEVERLVTLIEGDDRTGIPGLRARVAQLEHRQAFHRSILFIEVLIVLLLAAGFIGFYLAR